jgi:hypothetical protein
MNEATKFSYATGGTGFTLTFSEIKINGNISIDMNTNSTTTHSFTLPGKISSTGIYKITLTHPRSGLTNGLVVNAVIGGNNSGLSCDWDVTTASLSAAGGSYINLKGTAANSLGTGFIKVGSNNKVTFDNADCIGISNNIILQGTAKAVLNTDVKANSIELGGTTYTSGVFNATSHPAYFEGTGNLTIGTTGIKPVLAISNAYYSNNSLHFNNTVKSIEIYDLTGRKILNEKANGNSMSLNLKKGIYIIKIKGSTESILKISVLE